MKQMKDERRNTINFIVFSIGYVLLGLLMILAPEQSKRLICYILGAGIIVFGIVRIAWYFAKDEVSRAFHNDIPSGIILVIAGVYLIARPDAIWDWLPVILGLAVVFDSIIKLQRAFDLRRTGFAPWWGVLAAALATAVLGLLLILDIFGKNILVYYLGAVLVADGLINLATMGLISFNKKKVAKNTPAPEQPSDADANAIGEAPGEEADGNPPQ